MILINKAHSKKPSRYQHNNTAHSTQHTHLHTQAHNNARIPTQKHHPCCLSVSAVTWSVAVLSNVPILYLFLGQTNSKSSTSVKLWSAQLSPILYNEAEVCIWIFFNEIKVWIFLIVFNKPSALTAFSVQGYKIYTMFSWRSVLNQQIAQIPSPQQCLSLTLDNLKMLFSAGPDWSLRLLLCTCPKCWAFTA